MANTTACTGHINEVVSLSDSSTVVVSSNSEYLTAPATETEHATTCFSAFFSAHKEGMMEGTESGKRGSVEETIEHSKSHWSELVELDSDEEEVAEISNVEVFKALQMHPTWGDFFITFGEGEDDWGELVVGEKFAEGGQAELYEAQVRWRSPKANERDLKHGNEWVVKVFKKGTFLRHLQSQWPRGYLQFHAEEVKNWKSKSPKVSTRYYCAVYRGTLLKDGRFAFLLIREQEDLRSIIDRNMSLRTGQNCGPFSNEAAELIMYRVAKGMDWLHSHNIVHRDLKASNVLVREHKNGRDIKCFVADYECSIGVIGTGFFRAPEILQACKDGNVSGRPELFTKEADVYSFGMTCYEILTGKIPFEGHSLRNYDLVLNGQCPKVPEYVDDWVRELLSRCWHPNPVARPSFGDILNFLVINSLEAFEYRISLSIHLYYFNAKY